MATASHGGLAVIRADASATLGSGHVRRSLSFAAPLLGRQWRVGLAVNPEAITIVPEIVHREDIDVLALDSTDLDGDTRELAALNRHWPHGADLIIIDHYRRGAKYERSVRHFAQRTIAIDDMANRRHNVDALLDSAPGRIAQDYAALMDRPAQLLLGPQFALVTPAFAAARPAALARREANDDVRRILVSFGGTDPLGMTVQALQALAEAGFDGEVEAVFGLDGAGAREARELSTRVPFTLEVTVNATDMAARMARADLAIGAAGSSSYERCCVGLPAVVAVVADNQSAIASSLAANGAAISIGPASPSMVERLTTVLAELLAQPVRVAQMARRAAGLVDGRGAERAVAMVLQMPEKVIAQ
jgi:UDP-2,4-diacetamido-2,4,6-trideoxy-beta-L-altropyranose hydrolase